MTDKDYMLAFRTNNQNVIGLFYEKHRKDFLKNISRKFQIQDIDILTDIFQDSVIRLWQNVQNGKLMEESLTTTLAGYLYGIGEKVALETIRKRKEVYIDVENPIGKPVVVDDAYPLWLEMVEEPMRQFVVKHPREECLLEWTRLVELYQKKCHAKSFVPDISDDFTAFEKEEREKKVRDVVDKIGKPCAPLLIKFYWNDLSWEQIAQDLGYSNANSAKTQKNKCMSKIKANFPYEFAR